MINFFKIFLLIVILNPFAVMAQVIVSPVLSTDPQESNFVVPAQKMQTIPLPSFGTAQDSYRIKIESTNDVFKDITAYILDQQNLYRYQAGQPFLGLGYQKAMTPFMIQGSVPFVGKKFLVLDNRYAAVIAKKVNVSIEARSPFDANKQEKTQQAFEGLYASLKTKFIFPDFNIRVEPCGHANASSASTTGDISYCTELISNLANTNNNGAFTAIFFHEVGHSLLGIWGFPGNNNEDIADEFATYILMSAGPQGYAQLEGWLEFWQGRDSVAEARNMLMSGDRHSLSIQRIRNIKENMHMGEAFIKRWNNLIYPHVTDEALNKIIKNPSYGDDVVLAQNTLKQRQLAQ